MIARRMVWKPEPHETLHDAHELQVLMAQSMAHSCSAQLRSSLRAGQGLPPRACSVAFVRVRVCLPVPHSLVHEPQLDITR